MSSVAVRAISTVLLLVISNTFMTIAWYGHLKHKSTPLLVAILVSWSIALFEYMFQVPANRIGSAQFSLSQLKIMQECITLAVFIVYAYVAFREPIRWNNVVAMLLIIVAVGFTFLKTDKQAPETDETGQSQSSPANVR